MFWKCENSLDVEMLLKSDDGRVLRCFDEVMPWDVAMD